MTSKERIDAFMNHEKTDRTPFCLVDGGAWVSMKANLPYEELYALPDGGASKIAEFETEIDADICSAVSGVFTACMNAFGCKMDISKVGSPVNLAAAMKDPETEIPLLNKASIRDTLLQNDFVQKMLNQCRHMKALVGDEKYLLGDIAGPFTMAAVLVGTQDFIMLLLDDPDLVEELLDFTVSVSAEMFHLLHEAGCDIAFVAEPVASGSMISVGMFEEFCVPGLKKLREAIPEYKYFFTHVCGDSITRVPGLMEAGVQAFSCDYYVDLDQSLTNGKGQLNIMGNINPAGKILSGTPEEVYEECCERIRTANGRGFMLATGCDLSPQAPLENVKAMSKACRDMA